jgi:O-antigen/teichoic acid export membrane protein
MSPSQAPAGAPGPSSRALTFDVAVTMGSKFAVMFLQIGGTVLIARQLGPGGRGAVAVALALLLVMQQLGSLGLASANPYYGLRDRSAVGSITANSLAIGALAGALLAFVCLLIKLVVPVVVRGLSWADVAIVAVGLPAALVFLYLQSILLGQGRMVSYNLIEAGQNLLSCAALAVGLFVLGMGVTGSIAVLVGVYYVGAATYLLLLHRGGDPVGSPDRALARAMVRYASRIYVAGMVSFLIIRLDLFLVNGYLGSRQAGLYAVSAGLADGLFLVPMVIGLNIFPRIAGGAGIETTAAVFRLVTLVYGVIVLISVAAAGPVIHVLYGSQFAGSAALYRWLAPGVFSLGLVTVLSNHFAGRGFPWGAMAVWFVGLAVNLGINLVFLPGHGTYIAALSSSIAYTLLLVLHVRLFAAETGGWRTLVPRPGELVAVVRTLARRRGSTVAS